MYEVEDLQRMPPEQAEPITHEFFPTLDVACDTTVSNYWREA